MSVIQYGLTAKGRTAPIKESSAGKILAWMQEGHGSANPSEIGYELQIDNAQDIMEELVKGGYLWKETENDRWVHPTMGGST